MSDDFGTWAWLTADEREELKRDPHGPVRPALANRLIQINLGMGMRKLTSPTGVVEYRLPSDLAYFVSQQ